MRDRILLLIPAVLLLAAICTSIPLLSFGRAPQTEEGAVEKVAVEYIRSHYKADKIEKTSIYIQEPMQNDDNWHGEFRVLVDNGGYVSDHFEVHLTRDFGKWRVLRVDNLD